MTSGVLLLEGGSWGTFRDVLHDLTLPLGMTQLFLGNEIQPSDWSRAITCLKYPILMAVC